MNVSLPEALRAFVETQVAEIGYRSSSEYILDLIRNDQARKSEQRLARLLLEGLESGPTLPVGPDYWAGKREKLQQALSGKSGNGAA
jgi:antitoxin ParD1/3/4